MHKLIFSLLFLITLGISNAILHQNASALAGTDFQPGRIIDDAIFFDNSSMDTSTIQNFLNSKVPNCDTNGTLPYGGTTRASYGTSRGYPPPYVCLRNYSQDTPTKPGESGLCSTYGGGVKSAAQIIRDVANDCGINPKVLLILLEKEQSLVTDDWPWSIQYRSATGYGCPDTAPCDSEYYGFFNQVYNAARQFKKYQRDANLFRYRAYRDNFIQYNPNTACGGTNVYIQNQATAGLYNYTPYQPNPSALANLYGSGDGCGAYGNRNFWRLFNDWFGSTLAGKCSLNPAGGNIITGITFRKAGYRNLDQGTAVAYTGTGTDCIESHTWNVGLQSWYSNIATSRKVSPPDVSNVQYADLNGDGFDEAILVELNNTASGKIEFHVWDNSLNRWMSRTISDVPATNLSNGILTFADVNGDRRDEPVFILLSGTLSGKVELQVMNNDLKTFKTGIVTHMPLFNRADGTVVFADVDGNGVDEAVLVLYRNTGSGKVEFHTWGPNYNIWRFNTASNLAAINPANGFITFADVDGNGVDEAVLIALRATGSGKIEFHTWHLGVTSWRYHTATNAPTLP
jgi:hypothetical protein